MRQHRKSGVIYKKFKMQEKKICDLLVVLFRQTFNSYTELLLLPWDSYTKDLGVWQEDHMMNLFKYCLEDLKTVSLKQEQRV